MMNIKVLPALSIVLLTMVCCKTSDKNSKVSYTSPPAIIYKTKADYSKNVAVTLSEDKSKIISYPAPQDVYYQGKLAYPTALAEGFWLDNRGINANSAFIKMTYEEYSKLSKAPGTDELYGMIIDKNPFTEIYNLGNRHRFKNEVPEINGLIKKHKLTGFKKLK